ncbi:MAG: hypothetical protein R3C59_17495 [Planctomycetaceae bacterium]
MSCPFQPKWFLFVVAAVAQMTLSSHVSAQPPDKNTASESNTLSGNPLTREALEAVIRANYTNVETQGTNPDSFILWTAEYTPPGKGSERLNWKVLAQVTERPGQAAMGRVWFECADLAPDVSSNDLHELLLKSAGHDQTRAYFKTYLMDKNIRRLALVLDVASEDVTAERFPVVINGLFQFAYDTSSLWGRLKASPAKPAAEMPAKSKLPDVTLQQLAGMWKGDRKLNGKKNGEWVMQLAADGFLLLSRVDLTVADPKVNVLVGNAKVQGAILTLNFDTGQPEETYEVTLQEGGFVLTTGTEEQTTTIDLKR